MHNHNYVTGEDSVTIHNNDFDEVIKNAESFQDLVKFFQFKQRSESIKRGFAYRAAQKAKQS